MKPILVINSGSSSLKYQVVDTESEQALLAGTIERVTDHTQAFAQMLQSLSESGLSPVAVGHRVVHGGEKFSEPVIIDDATEQEIEHLIPLAPLHNPGNLAGIRAARKAFPELKQIAVFDTAFHQSMPESSYRYAIDRDLADRFAVRRYGFHGSSHAFVSRRTAEFLNIPQHKFNAIVLHLGNGASVCAVRGGKSVDTSMGMTPLQGLVMGSRSGDIDPGVVFYLMREAGMSADQVDELLNKKSGMLGLTGVSDFRDVTQRAAAGDERAKVALEIFSQRARHYLGAYLALLGRTDAVVFTGGVGENAAGERAAICKDLQTLGIELDDELNSVKNQDARVISRTESRVTVLVVPTNEELEIALQAAALI